VARRTGVHKVGMTASVLGLLSLVTLSFTVVAPNRLRTGTGVSLLGSLGWGWSMALLGGWVLLGLLSLQDDRRRPVAASRGLLSLALALSAFALCEVAALRLLPAAGTFARLSIGASAWVSAIAAYTVVLASRREVGVRTTLGVSLAAGLPVGLGLMLVTGSLSDLGMMREYANLGSTFWFYVGNTILYSAAALGLATIVGFALGVLAFRGQRYERPVFAMVSIFQTIPGLAMIGLLFAPLAWARQNLPLAAALRIGGLGWAPVVAALTLYALLAITRNTYAGLRGVPADVVDAGIGMGMTPSQVMWRVRVPLAVPVLFSGERTATIQTIGNSTLGAFVAAFTLGTIIFGGLSQQAMDLTMLGSVALVVLALLADGVLRVFQQVATPRRGRSGRTP
jgi:osmoprotectant transport system permease protein